MTEETNDDQRISDFNRGVIEGMKHQTPSPETVKEIEELKDEWASFKTRALSILIGAVVVVGGYGMWVGNINSNLTQLTKSIATTHDVDVKFDSRIGALEVNNGEVKAKLTNIETTLQEIKLAIKGIR